MLRVSVMCCFLFPCCGSVRQFWRAIHSVSWCKAARSQILEEAGNSDTGRLSLGVSWSPYFNYGTTSDSFQVGNTEVKSDLFMSSLRTGSITGSTSFQYYMYFVFVICTLSFPGALFEGPDWISFRTSTVVIARNLNSSQSSMMLLGGESYTGRLLSAASLFDSFAAWLPTEVKNSLNLFSSSLIFPEYTAGQLFCNSNLFNIPQILSATHGSRIPIKAPKHNKESDFQPEAFLLYESQSSCGLWWSVLRYISRFSRKHSRRQGTATEWTLCGRVPGNEILQGPYINLTVSVGLLIVGDSASPISLGLWNLTRMCVI